MKHSTPKYKVYLDDIIISIEKIEEYSKKVPSYRDFSKNNLVIDAVIRNLEIIGEAVKNLPYELKRKHHYIEWKKIAGFRDILIHAYFGVDIKIVWDVIVNKLPELKESVKTIIKELAQEKS